MKNDLASMIGLASPRHIIIYSQFAVGLWKNNNNNMKTKRNIMVRNGSSSKRIFIRSFGLHIYVLVGLNLSKLTSKTSFEVRRVFQNVTGFAKRGLPHKFTLPTLTIHNFRLENFNDLNFGQQ